MKKNIKRYLLVVLALVLVFAAGKFTSDYLLKATDGEENVVEEEITREVEAEEPELSTVEAEEEPAEEPVIEEGIFESEVVESVESVPAELEAVPEAEPAEETPNAEPVSDETEAEVEEADAEVEETDAEANEEADAEANPEADAVKPSAERTVNIFCELINDDTQALFTSEISGFDDVTIAYRWQVDDGNGWQDIEGANEDRLVVTLTKENFSYVYRLFVDVLDEAE